MKNILPISAALAVLITAGMFVLRVLYTSPGHRQDLWSADPR